MGGAGFFSGIAALAVIILVIILAVLAICMPYFIFRIYQETLKTNELLTRIANQGRTPVIAFALLAFLLAAPASNAEDFESMKAVDLEFSGLRFGQAPSPGMICLKGPCLSDDPGHHPAAYTSPVEYYVKETDFSHLGGIRIAAPLYLFYKNRLFQVSFETDCVSLKPHACKEKLQRTLQANFGAQLFETRQHDDIGEIDLFSTPGDALIRVSEVKRGYSLTIIDNTLAQHVRHAANPNYER